MMLDLKSAFWENLQNGFTIHQDPFLMRLIARLRKNLGVPAEQAFDPFDERPSVAVISKQMDQAPKASDELPQKQTRSVAVADIGCMDQNGQDQALRINEQVPLATEDFFFRRRSRVRCLAQDSF